MLALISSTWLKNCSDKFSLAIFDSMILWSASVLSFCKRRTALVNFFEDPIFSSNNPNNSNLLISRPDSYTKSLSKQSLLFLRKSFKVFWLILSGPTNLKSSLQLSK